MKKKFVTASLLIVSFTAAMAQDTATNFKPVKGANNLELNFVPLNGKPIQLTYIRYRRFLSDMTAFRLGIGISYSSSKADSVFNSNITAGNTVASDYKMSKMGWNIKPGYEKHFAGTNRLSPYIGAELDFAGQSSKEVTPYGINATDEFFTRTDKNKNKGGFFRFGVNALAGFDCYITKHLYLGTELGFGFQMVKYSDYKMSTVYPSGVTPGVPDPGNPKDVNQGSEINVGPNFNSAIRLGFIF
jgi:opacity protein-like surface antigen